MGFSTDGVAPGLLSNCCVYCSFMQRENFFAGRTGTESLSGVGVAAPPASAPVVARAVAAPGLVALGLVLLAGIGYLLLVFAGLRPPGRRRSNGRSRSAGHHPAAESSDRNSLLPKARSILAPRSHHETLHDRRYLDRILRAELEAQTLSEPGHDEQPAAQEPAVQECSGPDEGQRGLGEVGPD